ncbi:hypothetical protein IC575_027809 [Cucumis melo]
MKKNICYELLFSKFCYHLIQFLYNKIHLFDGHLIYLITCHTCKKKRYGGRFFFSNFVVI